MPAETTTPPAEEKPTEATTMEDAKRLVDNGGPYVDEDPFHRTRVNTDITERTIPQHPSANLERESNYPKNEEIKRLIEQVRSGQWEKDQRTQELQRRYGNGRIEGWGPCRRWPSIQQMRLWLGGEHDFTYDAASGQMVYHAGTEIARRVANIGWKTAKTAIIAAAVSTLTGGIGGASIAAVEGSAVGRTAVEAWRGLSGHERRLREEKLIARERYYEKATELANRIGPEEPLVVDPTGDPAADPIPMTDPDEIARYHETRHAAIKDLVNYVFSSEQHGVSLMQDEHGVPYIASRTVGEPTFDEHGIAMPIPPLNPLNPRGNAAEGAPIPATAGPGEPRPGGAAGPAMVTGSEVYQPSDVSPDTDTLEDKSRKLEDYNKRWDMIEEGLALAGGIAGGVIGFLHAKAGIAAGMVKQLASGDVVKLDLDGNGIYHGVQATTEAIRDQLHIVKSFIFHYVDSAEQILAASSHATVLTFGDHGSHIMQESVDQILKGINHEAIKQATRGAIPGIVALSARYISRKYTSEKQSQRFEASTEKMKEQQEKNRRRFLPDDSASEMHARATENLKPDPVVGDEWVYGDTDDWHKIKVKDIIKEKHDTKIRYEMWDPELKANVDRLMSIDALLRLPNVDCIKKPPVVEKEKKKVGLFDRKAKIFEKDGKVKDEVEVLSGQIFNVPSGKIFGYWEVSEDKDHNVVLKKLRYIKATKTLDYEPKAPELIFKNADEFEIWTKFTIATIGFPNKAKLKEELDK